VLFVNIVNLPVTKLLPDFCLSLKPLIYYWSTANIFNRRDNVFNFIKESAKSKDRLIEFTFLLSLLLFVIFQFVFFYFAVPKLTDKITNATNEKIIIVQEESGNV